jgi:hypothetical protein
MNANWEYKRLSMALSMALSVRTIVWTLNAVTTAIPTTPATRNAKVTNNGVQPSAKHSRIFRLCGSYFCKFYVDA